MLDVFHLPIMLKIIPAQSTQPYIATTQFGAIWEHQKALEDTQQALESSGVVTSEDC